MNKAVLFITFNRLGEAQKTFEQIAIVKPPRLYVASDGPRPDKEGEKELVEEIRSWIVAHINWDCEVRTRFLETNSGGCRYGVSGAIDWFFESEEDGIILEDDLIASQSFFTFCEELLDKYKDDKRVWHIAGDNPLGDVGLDESYYFAKIQHCWGWATWKDRWQHYHQGLQNYDGKHLKNFSPRILVQNYWKTILHKMQEGKIDSWAYQWSFIIVANNGLCINPTKNLVSNIGYTGVHYKGSFGNSDLTKTIYELGPIVHPKKMEYNLECTEAIYIERFRIARIPFKPIWRYMYRHPNFMFRKHFWTLLNRYIQDK